MIYTKEQLFNLPVGRLVDIIMSYQKEVEPLKRVAALQKKTLNSIAVLANGVPEELTAEEIDALPTPTNRRVGRPSLTPEQREAMYERNKEKQRLRYHERKAAEQAEETLPLTTE